MRRCTAAFVAVASLAVAACDSSSSAPDTTAPAPTTSSIDAATTTPPTSEPTDTAPVTTTTSPPTTTTTNTTTTTTTNTTTTTSTTTTVVPTPECDEGEAAAILDATLELARLGPGGAWSDVTDGVAFDERTNTVEEFADHTTFTCARRLAQRADDGAERMALIGWNDRRSAAVIQATDIPTEPYTQDATFQLFFEQPRGEFLVDQFVWAATMAGGESIVVATDDYSIAIAAKAWQIQAPELEDLPVVLDAERHAIDALGAAGARNAAVAEPAPFDSSIGAIMFNTPWALSSIATVGPLTDFDPMVPIVPDGDTTFFDVDGVRVRINVGLELGFELLEAGFECGDYGWRFEAILGTPAELLEFAEVLITSNGC